MVGVNGNGLSKSYTLGTHIADIHTSSFCGPQVEGSVVLPNGPSKSMLGQAVSFGFMTYPDEIKISGKRATDFLYNPKISVVDGEPYAELRTSGNKARFHASKLIDNGFVSPVYHLEDLKIQGWRNVTERRDTAVSYSTPKKEGRLIEGPERIAYFDPRDTQLNKFTTDVIDYEGPINKVGKYLSLNENFRQNIRNTLFNKTHRTRYDADTVDFIDFLTERYGEPRNIVGIGTGIPERKDAVARLVFDNKSSYLIGSTDFYEKAKAMAESYGLHGRKAIEFVKRATLYHEIVHNFHNIPSERDAEIDVGYTLDEFFSRKARDLTGTDEGEVYQALAEAQKAYAESWEGKSDTKKSKSRNLESKIGELEAEAISLGLKGSKARDYVAKRLNEEVDEEYSKESNLEEMVESDREYREIEDKEYNTREDSRDYNNGDAAEGDIDPIEEDTGEAPD